MLVYDVSQRDTFDKIPEWLQNVRFSSKNIPIFLVGNKIDLESERIVQESDAIALAEAENIPYIETSAKQNIGIDKLFEDVANAVGDMM